MIQTFIYLTPVIALIALLLSNRNWIKGLFSKKVVATVATNGYDNVMKNKALQFALKWRNDNNGKKQDESVYRNNGKTISQSEAYKSARKKIFELD